MDRPFKRVKVGDIIVCCDPFAHDYEEYLLRVTSVETEKAEITGAEEDCLVAYGEGLTKEDHEYIEESGFPFAIHENAFVCFSKVNDKERNMKEYKVRITETLQLDVYVEAEDAQSAIEQAQANWKKQEYILDADNFKGVEFSIVDLEV